MILFSHDETIIGPINTITNELNNRGYSTDIINIKDFIDNLSYGNPSQHHHLMHLHYKSKILKKIPFQQLCRLINSSYSYLSNRNDFNLLKKDLEHDLYYSKINLSRSILYSNDFVCSINGQNFPRIPNATLLYGISLYKSNLPHLEDHNICCSKDEHFSLFLQKKEPINDLIPVMKITHDESGNGPLRIDTYLTFAGLNNFALSENKLLLRKCHIGSMQDALDSIKMHMINFCNNDQSYIDPSLVNNINKLNSIELWKTSDEAVQFIDNYFKDNYMSNLLKTNLPSKSSLREFIGLYGYTITNNGFYPIFEDTEENNIIAQITKKYLV